MWDEIRGTGMTSEAQGDNVLAVEHRPLDHIAELANERGEWDAPALVLRGETLNHAQLSERVALLAGWLAAQVR
ncbi:MAG: hypothetical protein WA918_11820, partial [Erythrobacter sp.]